MIQKNKAVFIHFTLKNEKDEVLDTSSGSFPVGYIHGKGALLPALEAQLEGKKEGDTLSTIIGPDEGYGRYNKEFIQTIPLTELEDVDGMEVGEEIYIETEEGTGVATITAITDEDVTLDLNHPLADQTLHFEVEILKVRDASEEELKTGELEEDV